MRPIRVLVAKPGLDGHDRGIHLVARELRDAGMEVIYTGLHQTIPSIVETAIQEDVDVIGLSILSGAHLSLAKKLMNDLSSIDDKDIVVIIGGTIPEEDVFELLQIGVHAVYPVGTPLSCLPRQIRDLVSVYRDQNHE